MQSVEDLPNVQVISISPAGVMTSLQMKKGKGVDLRQFGEASINRVSEIIWDEPSQRWMIKFTAYAPEAIRLCFLRRDILVEADLCDLANMHCRITDTHGARKPGDWAYFVDYEDAVKVEVAVLNYAALNNW